LHTIALGAATHAVVEACLGWQTTVGASYGSRGGRVWRLLGVIFNVGLRVAGIVVLVFLVAALGAGVVVAATTGLGGQTTAGVMEALFMLAAFGAGFALVILSGVALYRGDPRHAARDNRRPTANPGTDSAISADNSGGPVWTGGRTMGGERRCTRMAKEIAILLIATDTNGKVFSEQTRTVALSLHGAGILSRHSFAPEEILTMRTLDPCKEAEIRVIGQIVRGPDGYVYGVAFTDPHLDFWQIYFPPALGERPRPICPPATTPRL